jgi:hypothetical protein
MRALPRGTPWVRDRGSVQTMADQTRPADRPPTRRRSRPQSQSSPGGWSRCPGNGSRAERYALGGSCDLVSQRPRRRMQSSTKFRELRPVSRVAPAPAKHNPLHVGIRSEESLIARADNSRVIVGVADEPKDDTHYPFVSGALATVVGDGGLRRRVSAWRTARRMPAADRPGSRSPSRGTLLRQRCPGASPDRPAR